MKIAYKLEDLCRLCLNQLGKDNIFEPVNMTDDIFTVTGVKVVHNDPLPQKICERCLKTIKEAICLKLVSKKNEKQLKYLLFSETDYNCDSECTYNQVSQQSKVSKNYSQEQKTSTNTNGVPSKSNDEPNTSNQILKVRQDLHSQSMIESNLKSRKLCSKNNGDADDKSQMVKVENEESSEENQSLLVPIKKQRRSSSCDEDQLFSYECDKCFKIFNTRKKFTLHSRTHEKKCRCPHEGCSKTFACNNDLYKHIRSHTGERPYQCDICLRRFTQSGTLRSHMLNIHGIQMNRTKGRRIKLERQFGHLPSPNQQSNTSPLLNYQESTALQTYEETSLMMPVETQIEEYLPDQPYESKFFVTSNTYESTYPMENESSETLQFHVQMSTNNQDQLSTENTQLEVQLTPETVLTYGQETDFNITPSIEIRLSSPRAHVDVESLEDNLQLQSIYFQPDSSERLTPQPTTSTPS